MTTRDDVRAWIAEHPDMTSAEIAAGLRLTPSYIREIIRKMARDGEIRGVPNAPTRGGGAPAMTWRVAA